MSVEPRVVVMNRPAGLGEKRVSLITRERWESIAASFQPITRGRVANLAAHNWAVIKVDDILLVAYTRGGDIFAQDGSVRYFTPEQAMILFPPAADQIKARRRGDLCRADGLYADRNPSEDGIWSLVHAGVFRLADAATGGEAK